VQQEIRRIQAVDSEGRIYIVLAITPIETFHTYHGVRQERGRVRHELNDGTAVVALSETQFRVEPAGTVLQVVADDGHRA
jgi:hypothetical protein